MVKKFTCYFLLILSMTGCLQDKVVDLKSDKDDGYYPEGNYVSINDQKSLEKFGAMDNRKVIGSIFITNVSDLTPISELEEVYGSFTIENCPDLTSLKGLENLRYIRGDLTVEGTAINNTFEFNQLISVTGNIEIYNNQQLETVNGFNGIKKFAGFISFNSCTSLQRIEGFNELPELGELYTDGSIHINNCPSLSSVTGFSKLNKLRYDLFISNCLKITDLQGFSQLKEILGLLRISDCGSLKKLEGFNNLTTLAGLEIKYCDSLTMIDGFSSLETVDRLYLVSLSNLTQITPFPKLRSVRTYLGIDKSGLSNLDFLSSVDSIAFDVVHPAFNVQDNDLLGDFCGVRDASINPGATYIVSSNLYNPDRQQIHTADCKK